MNGAVIWDVTLCSLVELVLFVLVGFLLGLLFDFEDGSNTVLRNVSDFYLPEDSTLADFSGSATCETT
jgi:hypothetical protein